MRVAASISEAFPLNNHPSFLPTLPRISLV
jgi:hypothetical protein